MDKRLSLQLNANRKVSGVLRGFDPFMNLVLDEAVEEPRLGDPNVSTPMGLTVKSNHDDNVDSNRVDDSWQ